MNKETLKKGTRIYYNGDMANEEGLGVIVSQQTDEWGTTVNIKMEDGREINGLSIVNFSKEYLGHGGTRFVTEEAYKKFRQAAVDKIEAQLKERKEKKEEEKEPEYISLVETAKIVRSLLKKEFPGAKFSVRSRSYSGGSSIDVDWKDGPSTKKVEALVGKYHGAEFDGMIDLKTYNNRPYANDFIFCSREYSQVTLDNRAIKIANDYGIPLDGRITLEELMNERIGNSWLSDTLHRELREEDL